MFYIDTSTAVSNLVLSATGIPGYFTEGGGSIPATQLNADWFNSVQIEIGNVITSANMTLTKQTTNQLQLALDYKYGWKYGVLTNAYQVSLTDRGYIYSCNGTCTNITIPSASNFPAGFVIGFMGGTAGTTTITLSELTNGGDALSGLSNFQLSSKSNVILQAQGLNWGILSSSPDVSAASFGFVQSFNSRAGNVTLEQSDVLTALGYTPVHANGGLNMNANGVNQVFLGWDGTNVKVTIDSSDEGIVAFADRDNHFSSAQTMGAATNNNQAVILDQLINASISPVFNLNSATKFLASESNSAAGGGFSFTQDIANDTGMFSSGDGILQLYNNGVITYVSTSSGATFNVPVTGTISTAQVANHINIVGGGSAATFNYAGQNGQPSWLWGTGDGNTMDVWNPSNFSVNYAATVGPASFPNSKAGNGYYKLPNGIIFQWGTSGTGSGTQATFFPVVFPTALLSITVSVTGSSSYNSNRVLVEDSGTNAFYAYGGNSGGGNVGGIAFYWMAIGY